MTIDKLYTHLSLEERAAYLLDCEARGDISELERIWDSIPVRSYQGPDLEFIARRNSLHGLALAWGADRWRAEAGFNLALGLRLARSSRARDGIDEKKRRKADRRLAKLEQAEILMDARLIALEIGLDELAARYAFSAETVRDIVGVTRHRSPITDATPDAETLAQIRALGALFESPD